VTHTPATFTLHMKIVYSSKILVYTYMASQVRIQQQEFTNLLPYKSKANLCF
jgi:hypothetical protein